MQEFITILSRLTPDDALLFLDETSMELNRRLRRMWWGKGERPEIPVDTGKKRINLIGAIEVMRHLGWFAEIKTLDAIQFRRFLEGLLTRVKVPGKIYVVLDNAPSHHAKKLKSFLKKNAHRLQLIFLPPYSPDFNPIEILWRELKKDVNTNHYFSSLGQLRMVLYDYLQQFHMPSERIATLWSSQKFRIRAKA